MASSSGAGRSLLKARNTAYMKNSLGSIFIRISHLLRCICNSPGSGHVNDQSSHQPDLTYGVATLPLLTLQRSIVDVLANPTHPILEPSAVWSTQARTARATGGGDMIHAGLRDLPDRHTAQAERQLMRANIWAFS